MLTNKQRVQQLYTIQHYILQMQKKPEPAIIYQNLSDSSQPTQIQSLCVNCEKQGMTTLLLTKIPFFRQILLASFLCEECGFRNNQVQFVGKLPDYGLIVHFRALSKADLNRDVIKSEHAKIYFQQLDLEIPVNGKAEINTIQGFLLRMYEQLKFHQAVRKIYEPQNYEKLEKFLDLAKQYLEGQKFPLTVIITDPSGNSNIKNPFAPVQDKNMEITYVQRTLQELVTMGYSQQNAKQEIQDVDTKRIGTKINFTKSFEQNNFMNQQPVIFEVPCSSCQIMGQMRMCRTSIPYFDDLVIMSFKCDHCGAHSTETKNSGQIKQNACIITLNAQGDDDLKRDLFKSQTCAVNLPQIEFQLGYGTLGGVFTTVEGLLQKIHDHFQESNPFKDSDVEYSGRIQKILSDLLEMQAGTKPFKLILIDPLAHSFISNPYHPDKDPRATIQFRPRSFQQNQELGINDMKVEDYTKKQEAKQAQNKQQKEQTQELQTQKKKQE